MLHSYLINRAFPSSRVQRAGVGALSPGNAAKPSGIWVQGPRVDEGIHVGSMLSQTELLVADPR